MLYSWLMAKCEWVNLSLSSHLVSTGLILLHFQLCSHRQISGHCPDFSKNLSSHLSALSAPLESHLCQILFVPLYSTFIWLLKLLEIDGIHLNFLSHIAKRLFAVSPCIHLKSTLKKWDCKHFHQLYWLFYPSFSSFLFSPSLPPCCFSCCDHTFVLVQWCGSISDLWCHYSWIFMPSLSSWWSYRLKLFVYHTTSTNNYWLLCLVHQRRHGLIIWQWWWRYHGMQAHLLHRYGMIDLIFLHHFPHILCYPCPLLCVCLHRWWNGMMCYGLMCNV